MRSHEIRQRFQEFFIARDHHRLASGPLVPPAWDSSVLITTAGMQPLKQYFLGQDRPPSQRLTSVQKCFRTVDIDEVGRTARHLTFFEMMGNFSIGDYFKQQAVEWAWEFVTSPDGLGFDPDKLWATTFRGDELVPADEEAVDLWIGRGVPAERIVRLGGDNFWQAGPVGPCGPCSELYYDRGAEYGCERADCAPGCDCDRFLEFWNLVFMQYNMLDDGSLEPLPQPSIDTGCGVERTTMLSEGVDSVYDTDAFRDVIAAVEEWSGAQYGRTPHETKALRVLADHGRAMTFLATDGIEPGNEGRGYVLRRVIRRAMLQAGRIGIEGEFLPRLHSRVVELLGDVYPELIAGESTVSALLRAEEQRFARTLETGAQLLDEVLATDGEVSAEDAFRLHDTYGFPFELTAEIAAEKGRSVDEAGFALLMEEQRTRARAAISDRGAEAAGAFAREAGFTTDFVGYERLDLTTQVGALGDGGDAKLLLKLRESPFYPRGGGQVADSGSIESDTGRAAIVDVIRVDDDQVLVAELERGELLRNDRVRARVDEDRRRPTVANHTATHLLHRALRNVLGEHVTQAGSYVGPDKLRFDFRHGQPLDPDQVMEIERIVNDWIVQNHPLHIFVTSQDHARELGATMLFGEKYGEHVRVVEIKDVSRELCGGTHVRSTAEIGAFVLTRETSSSQGIRRIEAITGAAAVQHLRERSALLNEVVEVVAERDKEIKRLKQRSPAPAADGNGSAEADLADTAVEQGGMRVIAASVLNADSDSLLQASDRLKARLAPAVIVLGSTQDGRVHLVANFDQSAVDRGLSAVDVIREVAPIVGGGGGGRPTMARAGGSDPDALEHAIEAARTMVLDRLGDG